VEANGVETEERHERVHCTAMFEVAQKRDRTTVHSAKFRADRVHVEQSLRRMFAHTIASVEYRNWGVFGGSLSGTDGRVANDNAIRVAIKC